MTPTEYLDAAKEKLGNVSDYELAKRLEITRQRVSDIRHNRLPLDNFTAFRLAVILEKDPAGIVADLEGQREKDEKKAAFFRDFALRAATGKASKVARTLQSIFIAGLLAVLAATGSIGSNGESRFNRLRHGA